HRTWHARRSRFYRPNLSEPNDPRWAISRCRQGGRPWLRNRSLFGRCNRVPCDVGASPASGAKRKRRKICEPPLRYEETDCQSFGADLRLSRSGAETYVTKAGMQEQTTQIMKAIEGVGNRIDKLHERLDRAFESKPRARA